MKKVLILGAGLLQHFVIKKAKELGYYTICVDRDESSIGFKYADEYKAIDIVDIEGCLECARECSIDGVLTAATDYGVLTASYIAEKMGLNGLDYDTAKLIKNKYSVRKKLSDLNIDRAIQYFEVSSDEEAVAVSEILNYPVIIKPCDGSGSKGIFRAESKEQLLAAYSEAVKYSIVRKALVETFVDGQEYGAESFVYKGKVHVLGVMKKVMTNHPYYAELGHCIPCGLPRDDEDKIKDTVKKIIQGLGINYGAVNMDLIFTSDKKVVMVDIGARMGGNLIGSHIIPYATGIDYMGNIVMAAVNDNDSVDFTPGSDACIGTSILNLTPGRVLEMPDINRIREIPGVVDVILKINVGSTIREYRNNLDGSGYIVAKADSGDKAMEIAFGAKEYLDSLIRRSKPDVQ